MSDLKQRAAALSAAALIACGALVGCSGDTDPGATTSPTPTVSDGTAGGNGGNGGNGAEPTPGGSPAPAPAPEPEVVVRGNVTLTGAETVNGDFQNDTWTVQPSCQDAADNGSGGGGFGPDGAFMIPGPYPDGTVLSDGSQYVTNLQIEAAKYQGPGSYTQIAAGIQVGGPDSGYYYDFTLAGTAEAIVNDDGSGSLEFTGVPAKTAPAQMVSGKITWTCGA